MKVLWFVNNPINITNANNPYNGGGWISSLLKEISHIKDIQINICYIGDDFHKETSEGIQFYVVPNIEKSYVKKFLKYFPLTRRSYAKQTEKKYIKIFCKVVEDCNPDLIQIFGSESYFGLIAGKISTPIVLHVQGVLNPYLNAFLPPFVSWYSYILSSYLPHVILSKYCDKCNIEDGAIREKTILKNTNLYFGRTEWDKRIINVYNRQSKYFYCSEILRDPFYKKHNRSIPQRLKIVSTISKPLYKGFDLILNTIRVLSENYKLDFEWHIFGNIDNNYYRISKSITGLYMRGVVDSECIANEISSSTLYFHSSYIDNSPNSVCEAMMIGVPVISTNVGGISSLISDGKNGYLIPSNDSFQAAFLINNIFCDINLNITIGNEAHKTAEKRHDKKTIAKDLINCYNLISQNGI